MIVLDEVFSVGDEAFQRKCKARMDSFREGATTVLLVSHSADTVRSICSRAAWLEGGRLQAIGPADEVTHLYARSLS